MKFPLGAGGILSLAVVFVFKSNQQLLPASETGPQLKVSSDRLVKQGIKLATLGLQGQRLATTPRQLQF